MDPTPEPTPVWPTDPDRPDPAVVRRAAAVLRDGGLVAFPTETVYGLGANALDPAAVRAVFAAKGRPPTNPLIVHVADADAAAAVAAEWPAVARALAERFWPGPLTLVVPKGAGVSDAVTAGGPTVAVRCPAHPVALALLRACPFPLAAPSANRSAGLSPTRAEHVVKSLGGRIAGIIDAGPCPAGIESTVVDVSGPGVRVLRPGPILPGMIAEVVGGPVELGPAAAGGAARSPGLEPKHYAPRTPLVLAGTWLELATAVTQAQRSGFRVGVVTTESARKSSFPAEHVVLPPFAARYAARLYAALHDLDEAGLDLIAVELPPDRPEWAAVRDRLKRAAAQ